MRCHPAAGGGVGHPPARSPGVAARQRNGFGGGGNGGIGGIGGLGGLVEQCGEWFFVLCTHGKGGLCRMGGKRVSHVIGIEPISKSGYGFFTKIQKFLFLFVIIVVGRWR